MATVNEQCAAIREQGKRDESPNERGNTIFRLLCPNERYVIDFADQFQEEGWKQFDTDQDAHYFGVWVNPVTLTTLSYVEGDWILVDCPDVAHYNAEIEDAIRCYREGFVCKAIDDDGSMTTYVQDLSTFLIPVEA